MSNMSNPRYPSLYQINTRVWLTELSRTLGRRATLDDIPETALDEFARRGFDWIWLLSVWQTGPFAQAISRTNAGWRHEFEQTLSDLTDDDIAGSGFAITGYTVHRDLGGDAALARLRERLKQRGLKLMLDFVPNHMAPDHPWVEQHPDYFVGGNEIDLARAPRNYFQLSTTSGVRVFAHGRDPFFDGWPDTIQLNYGNPALQEAMIGELTRIAGQCDGVRCDMAMLVLPDVFDRTWGIESQPFWPVAIPRVHETSPDFVLMAEVYWDLEWTLQQQGFNFCYDKCLYDRLRGEHARPIREHFYAGLDYQDRLARFLENHDEPRAAATFDTAKHRAAAVVTFLSPGLRFFHQGQFEGRLKRISPHLVRAPEEPTDTALSEFYNTLLAVLSQPAVRDGHWQLVECRPAWDGNPTQDCFIAFAWEKSLAERLVVVVNYSDHQSQAKLCLPFAIESNTTYRFTDLPTNANYDWQGEDLLSGGLYVDLPAWGSHIFSMATVGLPK
jgi:glycosidase